MLLGHHVYNRLYNYLDVHYFYDFRRCGFCSDKSTSMAIIEIVSKISSAMDSKCTSIGVFIDLSKAFDTVNHVIVCTWKI